MRRGAAAPERTDIDPALLRPVLADTFVVSADRDRRWPLEALGARTHCLVMAEAGQSFLELWAPEDRADVELLLAGAREDCVPVQATVRAEPPGREPIGLDLVLLPLHERGLPDRRLVGALVPLSLPDWYGLSCAGPLMLGQMRSIPLPRAEGHERRRAPRLSPLLLGTAAPLAPPVEPRRGGRPHLQVIEGGRRV